MRLFSRCEHIFWMVPGSFAWLTISSCDYELKRWRELAHFREEEEEETSSKKWSAWKVRTPDPIWAAPVIFFSIHVNILWRICNRGNAFSQCLNSNLRITGEICHSCRVHLLCIQSKGMGSGKRDAAVLNKIKPVFSWFRWFLTTQFWRITPRRTCVRSGFYRRPLKKRKLKFNAQQSEQGSNLNDILKNAINVKHWIKK